MVVFSVTTAVSYKYRLNHSQAAEPALGWGQYVESPERVLCLQPERVRQPAKQGRARWYPYSGPPASCTHT
jgi:hypothetical protein